LSVVGYKDCEIQMIGRCPPKPNMFMQYIQQHLSSFLARITANMNTVSCFMIMEGTEVTENLYGLIVH